MNINQGISDKQRLLGSDDASEFTVIDSDGQSEGFVHETTGNTGNYLFGVSEESEESSRRFALVGLGFSATVGVLYLILSVIIALKGDGVIILTFSGKTMAWQSELPSLALTVLNTLVTGSIGFVHAVTQRTVLAVGGRGSSDSESSVSPLQFNTNLRLCVVPRSVSVPFWHPNGTASNATMAVLLILSYTAASLTLLPTEFDGATYTFSVPLCMLGICTLCKTFIATAGIRCTHDKSLMWSSDPLVTTCGIIRASRLTAYKGRCMSSVVDTLTEGEREDGSPRKPSNIQPSAWHVRRGVKLIVIGLWSVVIGFAVWGGILVVLQLDEGLAGSTGGLQFLGQKETWYFFGSSHEYFHGIGLLGRDQSDMTGPLRWLICFAVTAAIQSPVTLGLHCCDLLVNVTRDESIWRKASTQRGVNSSTSALRTFYSYWPNVLLQISVPFLHWMYSFAVKVDFELITDDILVCDGPGTQICDKNGADQLQTGTYVTLSIVHTWYFAISFAVLSAGMTVLANWKPRGGQPATYGHIQTLANLVDEWPRETMWWGHKGKVEHGGQRVGHAGTSDRQLEPIRYDLEYA